MIGHIDSGEVMSLKELKTVLEYNPETGVIYWLIFRPRAKKGFQWPMSIAGNLSKNKYSGFYRVLNYKSMTYGCHRVAWFLTHGYMPPEGLVIDHIDGDTLNNKLDNLRLLTPTDNAKNVVLYTSEGNRYCKCNFKSRYKITKK